MTQGTSTGLASLLCILLLPGLLAAQSQQTANTLKLNEATGRPKATLADIKLN
ncbi:MAG: hypothetical protein ACR2H4_16625 [Pyrinomonadaceae bacterium]|jgi:hypothetical protein